MTENLVVIGKFGKTQGLDGHLRINSYTKPTSNIFNYQPWHTETQTLTVSDWQQQGKFLVAKIQGYDDIDQAKPLTDTLISVPKSALPQPEPGEYYWDDLVGLKVHNQEQLLGEVDFLTEGPQFDIIVVKREHKPPLLIPYEKEVVINVDLAKQRIDVNWDDIDE